MPKSIDWPRTHSPRRRQRFLLILAVFALIVFSGGTALSYYVDVLWFGSLGYGDVFWKTLGLRYAVFAEFAAATFVILYGAFLALKRSCLSELPTSHTLYIGAQPVQLPVDAVLRVIGPGAAFVIAGLTGLGMMAEWPALALYWYAPRGMGGVVDPIFGKPLDFYLFTLPAWQLIAGWLLTLAVIACLIAGLLVLATARARGVVERG